MMRLGGGQRRVGGSHCSGESKRRHQSGGSRRLLPEWSEWDVLTQEVEVESGHQIGGSRSWSPE